MPRTRFCIKEPLQPASLPPSEPALHPPQASQTHGLPSPTASRPRSAAPSNPQQAPLHTGCRPAQSGKARGPLHPISGPRRCRSHCRREDTCLRDLPRCGDPPIVKSTCWDNPPIAKTKISASLQLFCDCELSPVPAKRKRSLHTANYLHFCASIRNWEARNNCQSQKSCNLSRFFVSGLLE